MPLSPETQCMFMIEARLEQAYLTIDELRGSAACDLHYLSIALAHLELCEKNLKLSIKDNNYVKKDNTRPNK